jgi:hypothetical protein
MVNQRAHEWLAVPLLFSYKTRVTHIDKPGTSLVGDSVKKKATYKLIFEKWIVGNIKQVVITIVDIL